MKKFITKIAYLFIPVLIYAIGEICFIKQTTYRPWEALMYIDNPNTTTGKYYPNRFYNSFSSGDLSHHTDHAILKKENWITDKYGYRNDKFIKSPEIIIIGDSFIVGSSLNQDETISNQINKITSDSIRAYNMAPSSFENFVYFLEKKIISKPRLVIYSNVERNNISSLNLDLISNVNEKITDPNEFQIFLDKIKRMYLLRYIAARFFGKHGNGKMGENQMLFYAGIDIDLSNDDIRVKENIKSLLTYKSYCDKNKLNFLYLPMPNKETIYYEMVKLPHQPKYLSVLHDLLEKNNIQTINTIDLYNNKKTIGNGLLYQKDDSHWNINAVKIVAEEIIKTYLENECSIEDDLH